MNYKQHLIVGSIVVAILSSILYFTTTLISLDVKTLLWVLILTYIYSLLPDIDHPISTITWNFLGIGIVGITITIINNYYHFIDNGTTIMIASVILLILTFVCAQFAGHRGIIHTIRAGLVFAGLSFFLHHSIILCVIAFAAYYSHLCADGLWRRL